MNEIYNSQNSIAVNPNASIFIFFESNTDTALTILKEYMAIDKIELRMGIFFERFNPFMNKLQSRKDKFE